jgi:uncharacterized membrane protein
MLVIGLLITFVAIPIIVVTAVVFAIIRAAKEKPKGSTSEMSTSEIADELKKLAELHDQGVLTDEEFAEQKKKATWTKVAVS